MSQERSSWLTAPNVSWRFLGIAVLVWGLMLVGAFRSDVGRYLESRIARPVDFHVRDALGQGPEVSPYLKIFSYDDSSLARVGSWALTLEEWKDVLTLVAASRPRAIFIDAMFSPRKEFGTPEGRAAIEALTKLGVPVTVGSFISPATVRYRDKLDLDHPDYSLSSFLGSQPGDGIPEERLPPMADGTKAFVYGPAPEMQAAFTHVGHFLYSGSGFVAPLIRLGSRTVLPHMALFLASERRIDNGRLLLDGVNVPVDERGYLSVNLLSPTVFGGINKSMRGLIAKAFPGPIADAERRDLSTVNEGDVVLILPMMYTGHADFKQTPYGHKPGGIIVASMLNSVLTGEWLRPLAGSEALIFVFAAVGAALGAQTAALIFWTSLLAGMALLLALSQYIFAFQGIVVPWLFSVAGFVGAAVTVFAQKTRMSDRKVQSLRQALEGSVADGDLQSILSNPERVTFEARERVVTLMFIDVVGFSLMAENMLPRMAFDNLKKMLATMGETIHQFGGIIDKTLGDGLLCYFGYRFDLDSSTPDHAEQALRCAIKIQRDNILRNIEAAENGEPVYPLRVGINTSSCYLGDLGTSNRIDFTVVGNGVNFAKRLEGACEMHSVLMGGTTFDLVKGIGLPGSAITKRFIRIKHHSELVEAYEYDPVHNEANLRAAALEGFRKSANIERQDQRWPVHDPSKIQLACDFGDGQLVNFSHTGLSVKLGQLLAKGTRLNITVDGAGGALRSLLAKEGIDILQGEVRWGYAEGAGFVHGILLTNVSESQSDALVQYLCEFVFSRDVRGEGASQAKAS